MALQGQGRNYTPRRLVYTPIIFRLVKSIVWYQVNSLYLSHSSYMWDNQVLLDVHQVFCGDCPAQRKESNEKRWIHSSRMSTVILLCQLVINYVLSPG